MPVAGRVPAGGVAARIVRHGGMYTLIDQGVVSATNFFTGMIIGRACSREEFGFYMLGLSVMLVAYDLQTALITTPYMIHSPHLGEESRRSYTGSTLVHQVVFSLVAAVLFVAGGLVLKGGVGPSEAAPVLSALGVAGVFMMLREYVRRLLFARMRMLAALVFDAGVSGIQLAGIGLAAWLGILSAVGSFMVIGTAGAVGVVVWLVAGRSGYAVDRRRVIADLVANWRFGRWVFASGLFWSLGMQCYPWMLTVFHGAATAGVWAACLGVVNLANPVMLGVQNYLGPAIATAYAAGGAVDAGRYIVRSAVLFALLVAPLVLIAVMFGGRLVILFYGAKYDGYGAVVAVLGANMLAMALAFPVSRALFAAKRADLDCGVNLVTLVYLFTAGLWFVRRYGSAGAAGALLTANIFATVARTVVFMRLRAAETGRGGHD